MPGISNKKRKKTDPSREIHYETILLPILLMRQQKKNISFLFSQCSKILPSEDDVYKGEKTCYVIIYCKKILTNPLLTPFLQLEIDFNQTLK